MASLAKKGLRYAYNVPILMTEQPPVGQGHLIVEVTRSHSDTQHSVGLL